MKNNKRNDKRLVDTISASVVLSHSVIGEVVVRDLVLVLDTTCHLLFSKVKEF